MHILVTGGTGTIGNRLVRYLIEQGHLVTVLSRKPFKPAHLPAKIKFAQWDGKTAKGWQPVLEEVDVIVHLAGAGVADERWTEERKQLILDSRVDSGQAVIEALRQTENKPKVLVQSSAVGYYGSYRGEEGLTEDAPPADDFLAKVCVKWEASTQEAEEMGLRRPIIRTGVVLDPQGGALPQMMMPFKFFAGGWLGSGKQWVPWIHYFDEVAAIHFLATHAEANGPFNLTAPNTLRNKEFMKTIGEVMGRPAFAPAPGFALKLALGEMAQAVLEGQNVIPRRLLDMGFEFKYPTAKAALEDLID